MEMDKEPEIEFYTEILEKYSKLCDDKNVLFLWMCRAIIKLIKLSKTIKNQDFIRDGLIIILENYLHFEENCLELLSRNSNDLLNSEKTFLHSALKLELY